MTELEHKEQIERLQKYEKAQDIISIISRKKAEISGGISSINCLPSSKCAYGKEVDFDYFGEDFKERLVKAVISFLDSEIENIKKTMEDI